jgi:hypothetical protein
MPRHQKVTFGRQKSQLERPKKSESRKRQRLKVWKKRLLALGLPAEQVAKLQYVAARTLLKRPKQVAASVTAPRKALNKAAATRAKKAKTAAKAKA